MPSNGAIVAAVVAPYLLVVGCTVNLGGDAAPEGVVEVPSVHAEAPAAVPDTTVPPAPPQTLREKLRAIPGMTWWLAEQAVEVIDSDPSYEEAILASCWTSTEEYFVATAMEGAVSEGPLGQEAMNMLPQIFSTIWTHYCVDIT